MNRHTRAALATATVVLAIAAAAWIAQGARAEVRPAAPGNVAVPPVNLPWVGTSGPPCSRPPRLIRPANGAHLATLIPQFEAMKSDANSTYTALQYSTDAGFAEPHTYTSSLGKANILRVTPFENLARGTIYYWRSWDMCGSLRGPTSDTYTFTTGITGTILPPPVLRAPENGATGLGPQITLQWDPVSEAQYYQLMVTDLETQGLTLFVGPAAEWAYTSRKQNHLYEWQVRAANVFAYGERSAEWQFTTGTWETMPAEQSLGSGSDHSAWTD